MTVKMVSRGLRGNIPLCFFFAICLAHAQLGSSPKRTRPVDTPGIAGPSYVVLQDTDESSLVRVSADGRVVVKIADHAAGLGLAQDENGDYVVGARSRLLRVTKTGEISIIATAPAGAEWTAVAIDPRDGSFVVADGKQPALWRISADGRSVLKIASFQDINYAGGDRKGAVVVDSSGNAFLLTEGDPRREGSRRIARAHLFRVSPRGEMSEILLNGPDLRCASAMISDGGRGFLVLPCTAGRVMHLTEDGNLSDFAELPSAGQSPDSAHETYAGLVRSIRGDGVLVVLPFRASLVHTDEGITPRELPANWRFHLSFPVAIIAESQE